MDKFRKHFQEEYVFGLWRSYLVVGICWKVRDYEWRRIDTAGCAAPSWSWASCRYDVEYADHKGKQYANIIPTCGDRSQRSLRVRGVMEIKPFTNLESLTTRGYGFQDWSRPGGWIRVELDERPHREFSDSELSTVMNSDLLHVADHRYGHRSCILLEPVDIDRAIRRYKRVGYGEFWIKNPSQLLTSGEKEMEIEII